MEKIHTMSKLGRLIFVLMWIPFVCVFVGMAGDMGSLGVRFAQFVDRFIPGLIATSGSVDSPLSIVSFVLTFAMMFLAMGLTFGAPLLAGLMNRKVLKNGRPASARILSAAQTGTYINENPVVRFSLEVQPQDGMSFEAEAQRLVYMTQLAAFQPGAVIPVRYDPETMEVAIPDDPAS